MFIGSKKKQRLGKKAKYEIDRKSNRWSDPGESSDGSMMPNEFIKQLAARRIYLACMGNSLKYRAPEGAMDEAMKQMLRLYKNGFMQILRKHSGFLLAGPLSHNQQSLFFMHLLEPSSAAYNLALSMRLLTAVDVSAMRMALEKLAQQHEQLRTTYSHIELGETLIPVQLIHERMTPSFETIDARKWTEAALKERLQEFYKTPFDLEEGPIVRAGLFIRGEDEAVLVILFHHISTDAWSLNLIMKDLAAAYRAKIEDRPESAAKMEYMDFALAQRGELEDPIGQAHLDYWIKMHNPPAPILDLGGEAKRPAIRRSAGTTHYFHLDSAVCRTIERVAQEQGITPFALLLSVFQWTLFERSGQRDVTIGIPVIARNDRQFEDVVGYFINPVPLRCRRPDRYRFCDHARTTAQELRAALDHRAAPFAAIVERLGGVRNPAYTPVFQVMFNMLSRKTLGDVIDLLYPSENAPAVDFGGLNATACALNQQEGQFDVTLEIIDYGDEILALFKYCTDLFSPPDAENLVLAFRAKLDAALADPETALFAAADAKILQEASKDENASVLAIAASFTGEVLQEFLEFWAHRLRWHTDIRFAQYNQVFQELLNPSGLLRSNRNGHSLVMVRLDDLFDGGLESLCGGSDGKDARLTQVLDELLQCMTTATQGLSVPLCFVLCPSSPKGEEFLSTQSGTLEKFLEALRSLPGVTVITHKEVSRRYPVAEYYEPLGESIGHIPFTRPYLAALATRIVRSIQSLSSKPMKAIAVDCDGTLWEGVAAEDGVAGVFIGRWQRDFQNFLLEQYQNGVVLCLCSKNQETDVWAIFDRHPDMLLRREHFTFWKINWEPKSSNIRALAREINIGLDAIAFLDDNPLERAEVSSRCPSVLCLEFPAAWEERTSWLEHVWILDHGRVTAEDRKRQEHYRSEQLREILKKGAGSLQDFLEKLELRIDLNPAGVDDYDRLAQLSVRTNQFNTTVLRLNPQEVAEYAETQGRSAHITHVRDRFGDYGLVGGMLARAIDDTLRIEGLFLSCRALGRGVEFRMAAYLGSIARQAGCPWVEFPVRTTERNEPARNFLAQLTGLCNGVVDVDGTLKVATGQLASIRYESVLVAAEEEDPTVSLTSPDTASSTAPQDRELIVSIAGELRSVDSILASVERRTREHQGRKIELPKVGQSVPPETQTEQIIADVWKRVLGLEEVNAQAKFFEVGGTSLMMARIAIDLKRNHGLEVSIMDMFQYPTITDLAKYLDQKTPIGPVAGQTEAMAIRQRKVLNVKNLPDSFKRLKRIRE
jgi:FkbH-like protein